MTVFSKSRLDVMPTVILFDGIKIEMFANDHNPPHVHVKYAEHKCLLTLNTIMIYAGSMPVKPLKRAQTYVTNHRDSLINLWFLLQTK